MLTRCTDTTATDKECKQQPTWGWPFLILVGGDSQKAFLPEAPLQLTPKLVLLEVGCAKPETFRLLALAAEGATPLEPTASAKLVKPLFCRLQHQHQSSLTMT